MIDCKNINPNILPSVLLKNKENLPNLSGIYFAIDFQGNVQYIGRSKNLQARWKCHHKLTELEKIGGIKISYLEIFDDLLIDKIEQALIDWFNPPLNSSLATINFKTRSKVALYRKRKGYSQEELARLVGVTKTTIQKWENDRGMGSVERVIKLCAALDADARELFPLNPSS